MTTFSVDHDLREDEPSAWIPADLLPDAGVGDDIAVRSAHFAEIRTGVVAELVDDTRGCFLRVTFE